MVMLNNILYGVNKTPLIIVGIYGENNYHGKPVQKDF
jgi:hypothetical protein